MAGSRNTRTIGRAFCASALLALVAAFPAEAQDQPKPDSLGNAPVARAPSLDPNADTAPKSPAEIEADTLGPPVKAKTFRVGPDGRPK